MIVEVSGIRTSSDIQIMQSLLILRFLWEYVILFEEMDQFLIVDGLRFMLDSFKTCFDSSQMVLLGIELKDIFEVYFLLHFWVLCFHFGWTIIFTWFSRGHPFFSCFLVLLLKLHYFIFDQLELGCELFVFLACLAYS